MKDPLKGVLLVPWLFLSCSSPPDGISESSGGLSAQGKVENLKMATISNLLTAEIGASFDSVAVDETHLHGKFYRDNAWYYVIENPEIYISDTKVKELTMCFIDGILYSKKYELEEDISRELLKSYGSFKFTPLNHRTRDISRSQKVLIRTANGTELNHLLDRYQMKWDKEQIRIRYRFSRDSLDTRIFLWEEHSAYKYILASAGQEPG